MILDRLERLELYLPLHPRIALGLRALTTDLPTRLDGRYDLAGDDVFAVVQGYTTRAPADCVWEAHRRYIDIQFVHSGTEQMGHMPLASAREKTAYDPSRDVAFYLPPAAPTLLRVDAGDFAIFFPHDVHMPQAMIDAPAPIRKIVIKVAVWD